MSRRFFYAMLSTETNTFSSIPTTEASYEVARGGEVFERPAASGFLKTVVTPLAEAGIELVAGLTAHAPPGAPTQQAAYEKFRGAILDDLGKAQPVDAVLLALHGAMVSQDCLDCEGDLLAAVRSVVGPDTPIGAVLDPHAHLTSKMVESADVLAFMKEYPHIDGAERTQDVVAILRAMLDQGLKPTPAVFDCRLVGFFPTQNQPMRGFVDRMIAREKEKGVLTISCVHGFPWGDTPDTGAKMLVYTDGDRDQAARIARELHEELWAIKDLTLPEMTTVEDAVARIPRSRTGPLVIADFADNAGGGAPSDSTHLLCAVLGAGLTDVAVGLIFDPQAVRLCHEVGVGGTLELRFGKVGRASGPPLDLDVEIMGVVRNARMDVLGLAEFSMGDTAWVRAGGVDIVMSSERIQMYDQSGFGHIGLDPKALTALIVKSSNHFHASFSKIAGEIIYVRGPGALDLDFANLPYRRLVKPFYPRVRDPFST